MTLENKKIINKNSQLFEYWPLLVTWIMEIKYLLLGKDSLKLLKVTKTILQKSNQ